MNPDALEAWNMLPEHGRRVYPRPATKNERTGKMKNIEHWKREGFAFEERFPTEYDLWFNKKITQSLRRYVDGREWLSHLKNNS
jgi:hypothetical protein